MDSKPKFKLSEELTHQREADPGVIVRIRENLRLAWIVARKTKRELFRNRMREEFQIQVPLGPRRETSGQLALIGIGRETWLASCEQRGHDFVPVLEKSVGDVASISEVSDAYIVVRLSGSAVRETLSKICFMDFHTRAFGPNDVAVTLAAHIGVTIWRLEDIEGGSPVFEIGVGRSLFDSFKRALSSSAAEFGIYIG